MSLSCPDCGNADRNKMTGREVFVEDASKLVWAEEGIQTVIECGKCGYTQYSDAFTDYNAVPFVPREA